MKFIFRRPGLSTYIFFSFVCFVIAFKSWEEASWHFGYTNWALCCPMLFVLKKLKIINKTTLRSCHVNTAWLCSCHYSGKTEHLWNSSRRKQDILCTCIYRGNWKLRHQNHTGREELLALFQSRGFGNVCSFLSVSPDIPLSVPLRHEELLVQGGVYAAMWMKQQKSLDTQTETQTTSQTQDTWHWTDYQHTDINLTNLVSLHLSLKSGATSPTVNRSHNSDRNSKSGLRQQHHFSSFFANEALL